MVWYGGSKQHSYTDEYQCWLDLAEELGEREVDPKEYQARIADVHRTRNTAGHSIRSLGTESLQLPATHKPPHSCQTGPLLPKTADHCLHFNAGGSDNDGKITGYIDSDWANDSADRKSQGGHVFLCNGGAISWQSRKQDLVTLSTTEAEFIACSEAS